jgi:hypothetical protein
MATQRAGLGIGVPMKGYYKIVQPWGPDRARQSTLVSDGYASETEVFAELDRLQERMRRSGVSVDFVELIVVDNVDRIRARPIRSVH